MLSSHGLRSDQPLQWDREGADWPFRQSSRFIETDGVDWHVQIIGTGPAALLLHGTGSSSHSWHRLAHVLSEHFTLIIPDLPGHAFSQCRRPTALSLTGMAAELKQLVQALDCDIELVVGHSAGAAVGLRMALDEAISPQKILSLNGALLPFGGFAGKFFSPLARTLARSRTAPRLFAQRARRRGVVERLIDSTGSTVDAHYLEMYRRLASNPGHVSAALNMMANWDLTTLVDELSRYRGFVELVCAMRARMVPPSQARAVAQRMHNARVTSFEHCGHLLHEEAPELVGPLCLPANPPDVG